MIQKERKPRVLRIYSRKHNTEKELSQNLLGDFKVQNSKGKELIEEIFGVELKLISNTALINVTLVVSNMICQKCPRNFKRKKDLIVKWFDDNAELINAIKCYIQVKR